MSSRIGHLPDGLRELCVLCGGGFRPFARFESQLAGETLGSSPGDRERGLHRSRATGIPLERDIGLVNGLQRPPVAT